MLTRWYENMTKINVPPHAEEFFKAILALKSPYECKRFFNDILTKREFEEIAIRFEIARLLSGPNPPSYKEISLELETSTTTVTRVAQWLHSGAGGYQLIFKRLNK